MNLISARDLQFRYIPGVTSYLPTAEKKRRRNMVSFEGFSFRNMPNNTQTSENVANEPNSGKTEKIERLEKEKPHRGGSRTGGYVSSH